MISKSQTHTQPLTGYMYDLAVNVSTAIGSYIFTTMSGSHFLSRGADVITSLKSNHKGY